MPDETRKPDSLEERVTRLEKNKSTEALEARVTHLETTMKKTLNGLTDVIHSKFREIRSFFSEGKSDANATQQPQEAGQTPSAQPPTQAGTPGTTSP
jgi:hypothetical protein